MEATTEATMGVPLSSLDSLTGLPVKVFLASRTIVLRGTLLSHDNESLLLEDGEGRTVVYKQQILSVVECPTTPTE